MNKERPPTGSGDPLQGGTCRLVDLIDYGFVNNTLLCFLIWRSASLSLVAERRGSQTREINAQNGVPSILNSVESCNLANP